MDVIFCIRSEETKLDTGGLLWIFSSHCWTCQSALTALIIQKDCFSAHQAQAGDGLRGRSGKHVTPTHPSTWTRNQKWWDEYYVDLLVSTFPLKLTHWADSIDIQVHFQQSWKNQRWLMWRLLQSLNGLGAHHIPFHFWSSPFILKYFYCHYFGKHKKTL